MARPDIPPGAPLAIPGGQPGKKRGAQGLPPRPGRGLDVIRPVQRGARADQSTPGQGIGLAVVASIVQAYGGEIEIGNSTLGGAAITIRLPA